MAEIHKTTLTPSKLELIAAWLPSQPWFAGQDDPKLAKAGGFRLDDPDGEVGIEFLFVRDEAGEHPVLYNTPLSYRGAPLDGAEEALLGTSEHGVLGTRWVYDGAHDSVLVGQLVALLNGETQAQAQSVSYTADPTVGHDLVSDARLTVTSDAPIANTEAGTDIRVEVAELPATLRILRVLGEDSTDGARLGTVAADWRGPADTPGRGVIAQILRATEG